MLHPPHLEGDYAHVGMFNQHQKELNWTSGDKKSREESKVCLFGLSGEKLDSSFSKAVCNESVRVG